MAAGSGEEKKPPIYLDYNGTTPIDREVADAMLPYMYEHWGNPSSSHYYGLGAKKGVETARAQVAALMGALPEEITFMSNGTETINHALFGLAHALRPQQPGGPLPHVITQTSEHVAVLETVRALERQGLAKVTYLPVGSDGLVRPEALTEALAASDGAAVVVSIMHSNNETGALQPIKDLAARGKDWASAATGRRLLFHCDASQSLGRVAVNVSDLGIDLLTVAGHKIHAPKGVGALYARKGTVPAMPQYLHGAGQEAGRRASTENVIQVVALGKACEIALRDLTYNSSHMRSMRDRLHEGIERELKKRREGTAVERLMRLNGPQEARLPNTLSLSFRRVEANTLLSLIGDEVAASAGAACHSDEVQMSHVLEAMGVSEEWGMGTVRLTVGKASSPEEMDRAAEIVARGVAELAPRDEAAPDPGNGDGIQEPDHPGVVKLTRYTHGMGCACKLRPQALEAVLQNLRAAMGPVDPENAKNILVGSGPSNDDACAYQISEELAIVATLDFFTPVVDDPETFGRIAAANALSDVYAMGARPLFALNIVGFPSHRLPMSVLTDILKGGQAKCAEAGIQVLGGHSVDDTEPKYGLAVIGAVHPKKIWRNNAMLAGDVLVLTKPIGTGVLSTALKRGQVLPATQVALHDCMARLNRNAAEAAMLFASSVGGVTDVTGFGFLGHLNEMLTRDVGDTRTPLAAKVQASSVPLLPQALELASQGEAFVPGGSLQNLKMAKDKGVVFDEAVPAGRRSLLADAQTSGGLLISVRAAEASNLLAELLQREGCEASAIVGEVHERLLGLPLVHVVP